MTLGNCLAYGEACLLFFFDLDDDDGDATTEHEKNTDTLHLNGRATVRFPDDDDDDDSERLDGADCFVEFVLSEVRRVERADGGLGFEAIPDGLSPYNPPLSGPGADQTSAKDYALGVPYVLISCTPASTDGATVVRTFGFAPEEEQQQTSCDDDSSSRAAKIVGGVKARVPGQFVTLTIPALGDALRSYTISSSPTQSAARGGFEITVKRKPGGVASNWLHDQVDADASASIRVRVLGVDGGAISAFASWRFPASATPAADRVVMISAGVGVTPMLANLRAFGDCASTIDSAATPWLGLVHCDRWLDRTPDVEELRAYEASGLLKYVDLVETQGDPARRVAKPHLERLLALPEQGVAAASSSSSSLRVLLCGPDVFMFPIKRTLIDDLGVDSNCILTDDFTF
mmetsp:Transcript_25640/g.102217  ORF Transcript_25640/g.102217 Transcript_25640/m.102217 type:complete len:403 (-) Transcript_25640:788-1996(-)